MIQPIICILHTDGMTLASVCPGDQLTLTCHTTPDVTLLQWTITFADRSGSETRFLSSRANTDNAPPLTVGQTVFQFLRISTSPLTSMMVIDNVAAELNGTRVECSYGSGVMTTNTQIINVIGNGMFCDIHPLSPVYTYKLAWTKLLWKAL